MTERIRQRQYLSKNKALPAWSVSFRGDPACPIGVREDLAKNMVAEVAVRGAKVRNDFDRISIFQRPIFNATWNDQMGRWQDFVKQGEEGFTLAPTQKNREVVYRCQPFWYKIEQGNDYGPLFVSVAAQPLEGYTLAPMFKNGTDYVYRPSFELALDEDGIPHSRADMMPLEDSAVNMLSTARKYSANARLETSKEWFSDYLLLLVEFGRRDLHNVMHGYWLEGFTIENHLTMTEEEELIMGFITYEEPPFTPGERCYITYDDYRYDKVEYARVFTLQSVTPREDGTYFLDFAFENKEEAADMLENGVSFYMYHMQTQTGKALHAVTAASSGTAGDSLDAVAPIVWRGKENPWGNTASLLCDVVFEVDEDKLFHPYVLEDISQFDGTRNKHYRPCLSAGKSLSAFAGKFLTGYLISDVVHVWLPAGDSFHSPEKYWCTYMYIDNNTKGSLKFFRVGGNSRGIISINHGTFELYSTANIGNAFGGRLTLEGGMS